MIKVGVIGYGYWGPNLVRNFIEHSETTVIAVADRRPERLKLVQARYPTVRVTQDAEDIFRDSSVDAVAIATPVASHYDLAMRALESGKHVLVEKPLTTNSADAARLIDAASRRQLVLAVDHTFVYTGAVRKIRELANSGVLGQIRYYDSVRINLGLFQHDVNVLWDLAVHDLTIMDYVLQEKAVAVSATGVSHVKGQPENTAYLTIFFPDTLIGHVHVNWLSPVKLRQTIIGGTEKMVLYSDMDVSAPVKVYDSGVVLDSSESTIHQMLVGYRTGDMWAPKVTATEALLEEVGHFADCIVNGKTPETDGIAGLRTVALLEAASTSMANRGRPVELNV